MRGNMVLSGGERKIICGETECTGIGAMARSRAGALFDSTILSPLEASSTRYGTWESAVEKKHVIPIQIEQISR